MPKYDRVVRLHFRSVAMPKVSEFTALENAQRVYDSIGVKLEYASGMSMAVGVFEMMMLDASDGTCNWNQASDEQRFLNNLGGRVGAGPGDVVVYYVNHIKEKDGKTLAGCAGHEPNRPTVVVSASGSPWTLGHELGHVLLGPAFKPVHMAGDPKNLMFSPTANITANPPGFAAEQAKAIRASAFAKAV